MKESKNHKSTLVFDPQTEAFLEHELRLRFMEGTYKSLSNQLKGLYVVGITGVLIPLLFKYFGI